LDFCRAGGEEDVEEVLALELLTLLLVYAARVGVARLQAGTCFSSSSLKSPKMNSLLLLPASRSSFNIITARLPPVASKTAPAPLAMQLLLANLWMPLISFLAPSVCVAAVVFCVVVVLVLVVVLEVLARLTVGSS